MSYLKMTNSAAPSTPAAGKSIVYVNTSKGLSVIDDTGTVSSLAPSSDTIAGVIEVAVQSEMETGSSTTLAVTPGRQQYHPSAAKCWLQCDANGTINGSYNITSITDTGTGRVDVTIDTDFADVNYATVVSVEMTATTFAVANDRKAKIYYQSIAAGTIGLLCIDSTATTNVVKDPTTWHFVAFGDQ